MTTEIRGRLKADNLLDNEFVARLMLEIGFVLREAKRFDEAHELFLGFAELHPNLAMPLVALGTVELQRGNFEAALQLCDKAVRIQPNSLYARLHRGEALLFLQRRAEAEQELTEIIARNPSSVYAQTSQTLLETADAIAPRLR